MIFKGYIYYWKFVYQNALKKNWIELLLKVLLVVDDDKIIKAQLQISTEFILKGNNNLESSIVIVAIKANY